MLKDQHNWWEIVYSRNMRKQELVKLNTVSPIGRYGEIKEDHFKPEYARIVSHYGGRIKEYECPITRRRLAWPRVILPDCHSKGCCSVHGNYARNGFPVGENSYSATKLVGAAYGSKKSLMALQRMLEEECNAYRDQEDTLAS
jgi:hypothetical protein